jgi:hypothetical protein
VLLDFEILKRMENNEESKVIAHPEKDRQEGEVEISHVEQMTSTSTTDEAKMTTLPKADQTGDNEEDNEVNDDNENNNDDDKDEEAPLVPNDDVGSSPLLKEETMDDEIPSESVGLRKRRQSLLEHPEFVQLVDQEELPLDGKEEGSKGARGRNYQPRRTVGSLSPHLQLAISQKHLNWAVMATLFCVFTDSMNLQCTAPNYPLMVRPNGHPDSFPNTDPFGDAASQYMISGASKGAAFIANLSAGYLSDHLGRWRVILTNLLCSVVLTIAKYFARKSFWAFTAVTFANGLFGSTVGVSLGYMTDVYSKDRKKADAHLSSVIAIAVVGRSLGGLMTVVVPQGLFLPWLPTAFITFCGFLVGYKYVLEPSGMREAFGWDNDVNDSGENTMERMEDKKNESNDLPDEIDRKTLYNVIIGAVADNAGSLGLIREYCYTYSVYRIIHPPFYTVLF